MFWTDYGDQAMVARAGMDGSDIHMIADGGDVIHPTGLAIDYEGILTIIATCIIGQINHIPFPVRS